MQIRNAASVLPEPVGAEIRTSRPARISGQPRVWGSVVRPKRVVNHSEIRGSNAESTASILGRCAAWRQAGVFRVRRERRRFIDGDVGPRSKDQLASVAGQADTSPVGKFTQCSDALVDDLGDVPGGGGRD